MGDVFGPFVGRNVIEQAVLSMFQQPPEGSQSPLLVYYLAVVERQQGLAPESIKLPPGPSSYRGGVDVGTGMPEWFPMLTVNVKPTGLPEASGHSYGQWFEIKIYATVGDDDEDAARILADQYGIAIAGLIKQNGALGGIVNDMRWTGYPDVEIPDPDVRQIVRSVNTFQAYVETVLTNTGPPLAFNADPYQAPGDWPTVETVDVTVDAIPPGELLP